MSKVCFVDLDGVTSDNSIRQDKAMEAARASLPKIYTPDEWRKAFYSDYALFNPAWVALDILIEGAREAIDILRHQDYKVIFR